MDTQRAKGRATQNISLSASEMQALIWLARRRFGLRDDEELRRGFISWVIQDLLRDKMQAELGEDWEAILAGAEELVAVPA